MMLALALATLTLAQAEVVTGTASVLDGDTVEIHGQRIRFHGIDAPESGQSCRDARGQSYRCGQRSALFLSDMIGRGTVRCEISGEDRYERLIGVCYAGGRDLNAAMVEEGHALAYRRYSLDYADEENTARTSRAGMWQGAFVEPWDWRRGERLGGNPAPSSGSASRSGPDKDCGDFMTWREAQAFFETAGPGDPHRLDGDRDGIACEALRL